MSDTTRWILFGVAAVVLIGVSILRIGMRGRARTGAYIVIRLIVAVIIIGAVLVWRFFFSHH